MDFCCCFLPWNLGHASSLGLRACFNAILLPQPYWHQDHSEGADRVGGQMRGDKECPAVSGVTNSSRVWRKGAEKWYLECDRVLFADPHRFISPREGAVVLYCINCVSIPHVCGFQWSDTVPWLYGVHKTCAKTAAVSHGTRHVTTKQHYNHFSEYWKGVVKGYSYSFRITCDKSVVIMGQLQSREWRSSDGVPLVEFMCLVFTRKPGERCRSCVWVMSLWHPLTQLINSTDFQFCTVHSHTDNWKYVRPRFSHNHSRCLCQHKINNQNRWNRDGYTSLSYQYSSSTDRKTT